MRVKPDDFVGSIACGSEESLPCLERFRIDYIWRGERTLREACHKAGAPLAGVMDSLKKIDGAGCWNGESRTSRPLAEVVGRILLHHAYTRTQIEKITPRLGEAVPAEGFKHPELLFLKSWFKEMAAEMRGHMDLEEKTVFPYLLHREKQDEGFSTLPNPFLQEPFSGHPLQVFQWEHHLTGLGWTQIHLLTGDFKASRKNSKFIQALFLELMELEKDLRHHIHLENNNLFHRAMENGWLE